MLTAERKVMEITEARRVMQNLQDSLDIENARPNKIIDLETASAEFLSELAQRARHAAPRGSRLEYDALRAFEFHPNRGGFDRKDFFPQPQKDNHDE